MKIGTYIIFIFLISLSNILYGQEIILDNSFDNYIYENTDIFAKISVSALSDESKEFAKSLVNIVYQSDISKKIIIKPGVNTYENITYGKSIDSNAYVVNNISLKPFAYGSYLKMDRNEVVALVNSLIKEVKGIEGMDLRQESVERAVMKGMNMNTLKEEDERDHMYKVCYKQYVNNIPITPKYGELCFFIYPDMKIWSIKSTLLKVKGEGERVPVHNIKEFMKYYIENLREFDKVEFKDLKMYYKIENGLLNPVYTFTINYYKGNKISKSEIIITPVNFNGD